VKVIISHTDNNTILGHRLSAILSLRVVPEQVTEKEGRHLSPMCVGKT
jgi:hypothetical protein